ncbi:hypothetical protein BHM03_00062423 [Ensete ventricosum]|nr:hypothetical protein BHM03_00062423 [Ensete ventricosum]
MASPHAGLTTHGQVMTKAPCRWRSDATRASRQGRSASLTRAAARIGDACVHDRLRLARKGGSWAHPLIVWRPQRGPVVRCPQGATASRGSNVGRRGGCPLAG